MARLVTDRTGEVFGALKIINELGDNKVQVKCLNCGYLDTLVKTRVVSSICRCSGCGINLTSLKMIGTSYNELVVKKVTGKSEVLCECKKCGDTNIYNSISIRNGKLHCKSCYIAPKPKVKRKVSKLKAKKLHGFDLHRIEYEIVTEKYYLCTCTKCKNKFILSSKEMRDHACQRK